MPQINMFLDKKVDKIVIKYSKEYNLSKPETIKKIIREFDGAS